MIVVMKRILTKVLVIAIMLSMTVCVMAQEEMQGHPFNGVITDLLGNPIRKAKVYLNNPKIYAISDKKGRVGLSEIKDDDTLHVIYKKQLYMIPVEGRQGMRIKLGDQLNALAEKDEHLVDVGYGFVRNREKTSSSSGITRYQLMQTGRTNLMDALKMKVPGLSIGSTTIPGEKAKVNIRGVSSLNCSTEPLLLIDGVPVSDLDHVSISDVEYVEVIKDANIYGVRGANGVISVHTRGSK